MLKLVQRLRKDKKGAALVEYFLIVAGVALMAAAAVSTFGHKTADLVSLSAAVLPGAHADDNAPIVSGRIIETANTFGPGGDAIALDLATIETNSNTERLGANMGVDVTAIGTLVVEP
jgi:Flp pilus assembly pilin Flp